jgi:DNA-binding transcriptional LysR family regulator
MVTAVPVEASKPLSLDLLRTFLAVHRAGTLTGAARLLQLSQPSVTSQLRALEHALGQPLFVRHARGVVPTATADDLARRLDGPLDAVADIAATALGSATIAGRTLRLGGPSEAIAELVLPALAAATAAGMTVRVRPGLAQDLLTELATGLLDLVVSTVRPRRRGVSHTPLYDEEFTLLAAPVVVDGLDRDLLSSDPAKALQDLALLGYAEELPIIRRWWRHVLGSPPRQRAVLVVPDLRALHSAALAGIGATVLPRYLYAADLAAGRLVELLPTDDPPINTLYLAARVTARAEPHIAHAWDALLAAARTW